MKLLKIKTQQKVAAEFGKLRVYELFVAVHDGILNDEKWFDQSKCSCEEFFYEAFCIVDKLLFVDRTTQSCEDFVNGMGAYEKRYVDDDPRDISGQEERHRMVFAILYMAGLLISMRSGGGKAGQFVPAIMVLWRGHVSEDFSDHCVHVLMEHKALVNEVAASMREYGMGSGCRCFSSQIDDIMRKENDDEFLHGYEPNVVVLPAPGGEDTDDGDTQKGEEASSEEIWKQLPQGERVRLALQKVIKEGLLKSKKDYALIMQVLMDISDYDGSFKNGASFCKYLIELGFSEDLTNANEISKRFSHMKGRFPNWTFSDVEDTMDRKGLINIATRFVAAYRKGE